MDKTAQKRNILNKLHEALSPSGNVAEKFFNPQFQAVMNDLRANDDAIRSIVAGENIGSGYHGEYPIAMKSLVKSIKSNLTRREYMSAVVDLTKFHAKLNEVLQKINLIDLSVNKVHHEFLFKDLDDDKKKHLRDLKKRFAAEEAELIKQAGMGDFIHNWFSDRGRALSAWEKKYPKQTKQLKVEADSMHKLADTLTSIMISSLKDMAKARASRNVDTYLASATRMKEKISGFESAFKRFYDKNVKGFLEKVDLGAEEEAKLDQVQTDAPNTVKMTGAPGQTVDGPKTDNVGPVPGAFDTSYMGGPKTDNVGPIPEAFNMPGRPQSERMGPPTPPAERMGPPTPALQTGPGTPPVITPTMRSPYKPETVAPPTPTMPPKQTDRNLETFRGPPTLFPNTEVDPQTMMGVAPQAHFPTMKSDQLAQQFGWSSAHVQFYSALEALGNESPVILKSFISRYAKKIASSDPSTSIQLLNVAKSIEV